MAAFEKAFKDAGLGADVWDRVIAVVVQPGVEEKDSGCTEYDREKAKELMASIKDFPNLVFEGHSTDYQTKIKLRELIEDGVGILKVGPGLTFAMREGMIRQCFEDHAEGRYYASVPLSLIIIDGAVNDYTRKKGFFTAATTVDPWDCLVGCTEGLSKLKFQFNQNRLKTNTEPIYIPYRNGILHGRDINYGNEYVSCKCIALMFAIADWMVRRSAREELEREELQKEELREAGPGQGNRAEKREKTAEPVPCEAKEKTASGQGKAWDGKAGQAGRDAMRHTDVGGTDKTGEEQTEHEKKRMCRSCACRSCSRSGGNRAYDGLCRTGSCLRTRLLRAGQRGGERKNRPKQERRLWLSICRKGLT